jgi:hypothetical protein
MLLKECKRLDTGQTIIVNLSAVDILADYEPKGKPKDENTCVLVMRCGMVLHIDASKKSIEASMKNYRG